MIHHFRSTAAAYDACQCDENIMDGDVLVIESEQVVGVADTWPFAVTKKHGSLHTKREGSTWEACAKAADVSIYSVEAAQCEAEARGYALDDPQPLWRT